MTTVDILSRTGPNHKARLDETTRQCYNYVNRCHNDFDKILLLVSKMPDNKDVMEVVTRFAATIASTKGYAHDAQYLANHLPDHIREADRMMVALKMAREDLLYALANMADLFRMARDSDASYRFVMSASHCIQQALIRTDPALLHKNLFAIL